MKNLSEEELAFIEKTLEAQDDVEVQHNPSSSEVLFKKVERIAPKRHKIPAYKNPMHWAAGLVLAPILLSGAFMFLVFRVEAMFGSGTLRWFSEDPTGEEVKSIATAMGITWLEPLINVYSNRWLIIAGLFTVFFVVAIIVILYDNILQPQMMMRKEKKAEVKEQRKQKATQKSEENDKTEENEETNQA